MFSTLCDNSGADTGFQKLWHFWVAIVLIHQYILCKILIFSTRATEKVFNTPGSNYYRQSCHTFSTLRVDVFKARSEIEALILMDNHCKQCFDYSEETQFRTPLLPLRNEIIIISWLIFCIFRPTESRNHLLYLLLMASSFQLFRELLTKKSTQSFFFPPQNLSNIFLFGKEVFPQP